MRNIRKSLLFSEKSSGGNILIGFLIFLPVLLSCLAILSTSSFYLKEKTRVLSICRQHLLEIQNQMSIALDQLEKLNPLAKQLRLQRRNLEYLLSISDIASKPLILAKLARVTARQIKLSAQQKLIIRKVEGYALKHLRLLKTKIYGSKKTFLSSLQIPGIAKLAVVATPAMSLSPSYKTVWNFTQRQSIKVSWIEKPTQVVPSFLKTFIGHTPSVNEDCRSTLRRSTNNLSKFHLGKFMKTVQGVRKWQPILL